jgi:hypothetical protein
MGAPAHLFAPTRITPPALADASTISVTPNNHPSAGVSQANAGQPAFNPFSTPTVPARPPSQPIGLSTRPTETKRPRRLLMSVPIAVLALLLVGTASAALILSRQPQSGGSGNSLTGNGVTATSASGGASGPIGGTSPTAPPPPGSTDTPTPTFGSTDTPPPGATDTPLPTNTPAPQPTNPPPPPPTSITFSASDTVAAQDSFVTLTAQTDRPVDNTGYSIFFSGGGVYVSRCDVGSTCISRASITSRNICISFHYSAYVAPTVGGNSIVSAQLDILWINPIIYSSTSTGVPAGTTVTISASFCPTGVEDLTGTGYTLNIVDLTTGQQVASSAGPITSGGVVSNTPGTHYFIAYVEKTGRTGTVAQTKQIIVVWT